MGDNRGTIQGCSSAAAVQYGSNTGGVVGYNVGGGTVTACYSTGNVQGNSSNTGGVVGYNANDTDGSVYACYWSSTDEYLHGIGGGNVNADGGTAYGADAGHRVPNNISWTNATTAMNDACGDLYDTSGTGAPKLTWE